MELLLVRHAQTHSNVVRALDTAHPGADLTALGERQVRELADVLVEERIDAVHSSPRLRARRTAAGLAEPRGLEVVPHEGLAEIAAGAWEMSTEPAAIDGYHRVLGAWFDGDLDARMPGAETGHDVLARFDAAMAEILGAVDEGARVAVVAHGAVLRFWCGARVDGVAAALVEERPLRNTGLVRVEGSPGAWARASGTSRRSRPRARTARPETPSPSPRSSP